MDRRVQDPVFGLSFASDGDASARRAEDFPAAIPFHQSYEQRGFETAYMRAPAESGVPGFGSFGGEYLPALPLRRAEPLPSPFRDYPPRQSFETLQGYESMFDYAQMSPLYGISAGDSASARFGGAAGAVGALAPPAPSPERVLHFDRDYAGLLIKNAKSIGQRTNASVWVDADKETVTIRGAGAERAEIAIRNLLTQAAFPRRVSLRFPGQFLKFVPCSGASTHRPASLMETRGGPKVECFLDDATSARGAHRGGPGDMGAAWTPPLPQDFDAEGGRGDVDVTGDDADLSGLIEGLLAGGAVEMANILSVQLRFGYLRFRVPTLLVGAPMTREDVRRLLEADRQVDIHMDYRLSPDKFARFRAALDRSGLPDGAPDASGRFLKLFLNHKYRSRSKQCHVNFRVGRDGSGRAVLAPIVSVPGEDVSRTLLQSFYVPVGQRLALCVELKGRTPGQIHAAAVEATRHPTAFESALEMFKTQVQLGVRGAPVVDDEALFSVSARREKDMTTYRVGAPAHGTCVRIALSHIRQFRGDAEEAGRLECSGQFPFPEEARGVAAHIARCGLQALRVASELLEATGDFPCAAVRK